MQYTAHVCVITTMRHYLTGYMLIFYCSEKEGYYADDMMI